MNMYLLGTIAFDYASLNVVEDVLFPLNATGGSFQNPRVAI